jgi:hypothetical protein
MNLSGLLRCGAPILLAAGIVACGGPAPTPPPESAPPSIEPSAGSVCGIVADMDALVGRTAVAAPSSYTVGSSERCLWVYVTDPSRYVGLTLGEPASHAATIQSFGDGEVVDGLGDEARWWDANRTLSVLDGERALQVDLQLDDAADPKALAVSIAQAALVELP